MEYQDINAATVDRWVEEGWEWGKPIDHETFLMAKAGQWNVLLTPTKPVPHTWFGELKGKRVFGARLRRRTANACVRRFGGGLYGVGLLCKTAAK